MAVYIIFTGYLIFIMTHDLEFIGFESPRYAGLKESISSYLSVKNLNFKMVESGMGNGEGQVAKEEPVIKYRDHFINFSDQHDIKTGLSRLHHLIHEAMHGKTKSCLNCANCRCRNKK